MRGVTTQCLGEGNPFPGGKGFPSPRPPSFPKGLSFVGKGISHGLYAQADTLMRILVRGLSGYACVPGVSQTAARERIQPATSICQAAFRA